MEDSKKQYNRMVWWREAKFGMFIHWGLYSIPAGVWKDTGVPGIGEWIMQHARIPVKEYEKLAKRFNPVKFNSKEWVRIAKEAGMKWIVITAKHHDGFCMFDTKLTDYNIVKATPYKRDPIKDLAEACKESGIRLGFYYSQTLDWHHPDGMGNDWDFDPNKKNFCKYLENYVKPQVCELLTNYGPVAVIWFDIFTPTYEQARDLREFVRKLQPSTIISGRINPGRWEKGIGDYRERGDNEIPTEKIEEDWETPATINDTWGFKSYDHNWKSSGILIYNLVDIISKGGNYLLNVGPTAEGMIPEPSVYRLKEVGKWLKVNSESIYGTRASSIRLPSPYSSSAAPMQYSARGIQSFAPYRCTTKPGKLYIHIFAWPWNGKFKVSGVSNKVEGAYLLADPTHKKLKFTQDEGDVIVKVPDKAVDPLDTVLVLEISSKTCH